ncbi:MAG: hypothetical protein K1X94_09165 [Sandaracinaceae bacterium]|nr:hypothetical protein [Sandaracinaceae bacterium]
MNALAHGLDRVRLGWLQLLGPLTTPFVRSRELRSSTSLVLSISLAFFLTCVAPLELLAIGPLVMGVPHLAADVRYLVLRPGLHRRPAFWVAVVAPLVALGATASSWLGFVAVCGAALALPRQWTARRIAIALGALVLAGLAWQMPRTMGPVMAHVHNLVAVSFFVAWPALVARRRESRWHWLPTGLFVVLALAIFAGLVDPLALDVGGIAVRDGFGTPLDLHTYSLAPRAVDPSSALAMRLVLFFAFAQSVHYGAWLRAIPDEDRPRATPRTFRAAFQAMREEGSYPVMVLFLVLAIALGIWAAFDVYAARMGYLRGALFHGYLELAVAAVLVASPGRKLAELAQRGAA